MGIEVQVTELDLIDLPIPLSNLIDIGGLVLGGPHLNVNGDIVADAMLIVEVSLRHPGGEAVSQHTGILNVLHVRSHIVVDKLRGVILLTIGNLRDRLAGRIHGLSRGIDLTMLQHDAMVCGNARTRITDTSHPGIQVLTHWRTRLLIYSDSEGIGIVTDQGHIGETLTGKAAFELHEVHAQVANAIDAGVARLNDGLEDARLVREALRHEEGRGEHEESRSTLNIGVKPIQVLLGNVNTVQEVTELVIVLRIGLDVTLNSLKRHN